MTEEIDLNDPKNKPFIPYEGIIWNVEECKRLIESWGEELAIKKIADDIFLESYVKSIFEDMGLI